MFVREELQGSERGRRKFELLSNANFKAAVNISNEFDWLSILRDTRLFLRTGCNASLTSQIIFIPVAE